MEGAQISRSTQSSIDLPEITRLMIVGASDTSFKFSENLQNIGLFEKIHHVENSIQAIQIMTDFRFAVIVIDADAEIDVVSYSRIINVNNPQTQIIMITSKVDYNEALRLKNHGTIHGFIPIPNVDPVVHSIIIQAQSKYQLSRSLRSIVRDPPKFTELYDKINQKRKQFVGMGLFQFKGFVVLKSTVVKYSYFVEEDSKLDPYLLSSYLSAMSIYSNKLFEIDHEFQVSFMHLDEQTIFMKDIGEYQYLFFTKVKSKDDTDKIIKRITPVFNRIQVKFQEYFDSELPDIDQEKAIHRELNQKLGANQANPTVVDENDNPVIANFDNPDSKLMNVFNTTDRVYSISDFIDPSVLLDFVKNETCNVVILNNMDDHLSSSKDLIQQIKQVSPYTQVIGTVSKLTSVLTTTVLNNDLLDKVIHTKSSIETYYELIKESVAKSLNIRKLSGMMDFYKFYFSSNQTEVIKTLLLEQPETVYSMTVPQLLGMMILQDEKVIYTKFIVEKNNNLIGKEEFFADFINSLITFSNEYTDYSQTISSVKFGQSHLVVENTFGYSFVYFISDLDQSNLNYVEKYLRKYTSQFFQAILNRMEFAIPTNDENLLDYLELKAIDLMINLLII